MRKIIIIFIGIIALYGVIKSAPRQDYSVTKTYINNGNTRVPFSVSVASTSWTAVLSTQDTRRYSIIETTSTALPGFICLSTTTTSGTTCTNSSNGQKLGLVKYYIEDYNEAPIYARLQDGIAGSVYIVGEIQYDSKD
jgi:hypothetical protein